MPTKSRFCSRREAWRRRALLMCLACVAATVTACAQLYLITDLGTNKVPEGINNNGDVVGNVPTAYHAFYFTNGVFSIPAGGPVFTNNGANAINNLGQSVGWYVDSFGGVHAFITTNSSTIQDLGVGVTAGLAAPFRWNGAVGINDAGQILGTRTNTTPRAYLLANGQTNDLPTVYGTSKDYTIAGGLSQSGAVAYMGGTNPISQRACLYTNGIQFVLPTPPNMTAYVSGINDSNQVVGYLAMAAFPFAEQVFLYDGSIVTNIGGFGTNFANPGSVCHQQLRTGGRRHI